MSKSTFAFLMALLWTAPAFAQDRGQLGITMGYPTSVGLLWHVTDSVGLRPEVSGSGGSSEQTGPVSVVTTTEGSAFSLGMSALVYVKRWDNLRAYVSPRVSYARTTATLESTLDGPIGTVATETTTTSTTASGSFGAQYALHRRFSVFGEIGFAYTASESELESRLTSSRIDNDSWSTRSGVGVIFYFK